MSRLQHFQRYLKWYGLAMLSVYMFANASILASTVIMDAQRGGAELPFQWWEPWVWEFSSAIAIMGLILPVVWFRDKFPLDVSKLFLSILAYSGAGIIFSVVHVGLMVAIRKLCYVLFGLSYQFGSLPYEFFYELRKDLQTFVIILLVSFAFRFIVSRLMGEANIITEGEGGNGAHKIHDRLLVKKLGKEFIVKLEDVEWMESSGNYVNLHIKERIYPVRKTLGAFSTEVAEKGFCRIHRSHAINLDSVDSITSLGSGDGEVTLKSGKVLNISRRYKDALKQRLL